LKPSKKPKLKKVPNFKKGVEKSKKAFKGIKMALKNKFGGNGQ